MLNRKGCWTFMLWNVGLSAILAGCSSTVPATALKLKALPYVDCISLPDGDYVVGCDTPARCPANPTRTVSIKRICVDRLQVSAAELNFCIEEGACHGRVFPSQHVDKVAFANASTADEFCKIRGGRLPQQVEAEVVVRGNGVKPYPWGSQPHPGGTYYQWKEGFDSSLRRQRIWEKSWIGVEDIVNSNREIVILENGFGYRGPSNPAAGEWEAWEAWFFSKATTSEYYAFRCVYDQN